MFRTTLLSLTLTFAVAPTLALAQSGPEMAAASPAAQVHQRVGLTDIAVEYSSPGVKGRTIYGELVPYGKIWRTGANKATKISFSKDVKFGGKKVAAGDYSLFTIPTAKGWTVVLNRNTELWGAGDYDKKKDAARVKADVSTIPNRERLTFLFSDTTDDGTRLDLEWADKRIAVPIEVETKAQVLASIDSAVKNAWVPHMRSAQYMLENGDEKKALEYIDTSIAITPTWRNEWIKAQVLAKMGKKKEAGELAKSSLKKGDKSGAFNFYKPQIEDAAKNWK